MGMSMNNQSNITDAEWQIMRMIWAGNETKSADIIAYLGNSKGWSPTTIKTLLARLVKKKCNQLQPSGHDPFLLSAFYLNRMCAQ